MIDYYKCQYHFNASHSFDGNKEQAHSHTFTMILYIRNLSGRDMDFKRLDRMIEIFLGRYEGMYLNELPCFCLLYTSPSPRDMRRSRMPSSA